MSKRPLVLVADDERLIADTLVEILETEGFEATAVFDGLAAVEFAKLAKPDVVVCDVMMPRLNGVEAAKQIVHLLPSAAIILFSGQAASLDAIQSAASEGYRFEVLAKPIKPESLINVIHQHLGSRLPQD